MLLETSVEAGGGASQLTAEPRLCRPSQGRSLGATVVLFAEPVHLAVHQLGQNVKLQGKTPLFEFLLSREATGVVPESSADRLAWFAINVAVLHAVCHGAVRVSPLTEAILWFFQRDQEYASGLVNSFDRGNIHKADALLAQLLLDNSFFDLLPYVLEPHGHVTRGHLQRSATAAEKRARKRHAGVYYTPSDVAEFMVRTLTSSNPCLTWIDPACGTAVFLREIVRQFAGGGKGSQSALDYCAQSIFGLDISPLATESGAFVLLMECARRESIDLPSAFDAWRVIARNIRPSDATYLRSDNSSSLFGHEDEVNCVTASRMFPNRGGKFDRVIMNPPYSPLLIDSVRKASWASFQDMPLGASANASVAFVEMMWKLAKPDGSAAAVVPLSIGASSHRQFKACRQAIKDAGGVWQFLFFDREPHALFGEDIKTRNAIIFHHGSTIPAEFHTSRMLKWTSALRPRIFTRSRTARIADRGIENFIPKLGTDAEVRLYETLVDLPGAGRLPFKLSRTTWTEIAQSDNDCTIGVGSSAYNFLNTFLPSGLRDISTSDLSQSPLHALIFDTRQRRDIAYAILNSTPAFWLWHTEGDGFHVTADFLTRLPLWREAFFNEYFTELAELGRAAWNEAAATRLKSVNGGKSTYSFHCSFDGNTVQAIDRLLLSGSESQQEAHTALASFIAGTVSIDGTKRRRTI